MIEEVFEDLVDQFSDPFTFYRELIQNAMDAGSNQVEVSVEYDTERRAVAIAVADAGQGMDREIIQNELTRLFSSSKENDLTKIGKFGIGFVSVFAIQPDIVLVDTGQGGEFWRVAFEGGTDYKCLRLREPVEGTTVRVYKNIKEEDFEEFRHRSLDTVRYWCRYSDTDIFFNGERINEGLDVDSPCRVFHRQPGTEIVVGYTSSTLPAVGMYNRGLTLKEARQESLPGITFRIKSRYLEHTLTRDNVLEDDNYFKAMKILAGVVREDLTEKLFGDCQACFPDTLANRERLNELMAAAGPVLRRWKTEFPKRFHDRALFPCVEGGARNIEELRWAALKEGAVYVDSSSNHVTRVLHQFGIPVVRGEAGSAVASALEAVTGYAPRLARQSVAAPVPLLRQIHQAEIAQISGPVIGMLRRGKTAVRRILLADFGYEGSSVKARPCLAQFHDGEPVRLFERGFWRSLQKYPGLLLLNHEHSLVRKAIAQAENNPLLAAFVIAKAALLQDGLPGDLEAKIVQRCVGMR
ncbi:MAG: ATP-binding protein [Armatimonadetes bacterium]|nr:ATP-binding protein [Armatimonadota bacterium]